MDFLFIYFELVKICKIMQLFYSSWLEKILHKIRVCSLGVATLLTYLIV